VDDGRLASSRRTVRKPGSGCKRREPGCHPTPSKAAKFVSSVSAWLRIALIAEAGAGFMASVGLALTAVEEAGERLRSAKGQVTGGLRLNVPRVALPIAVTPIVAEMAWRYPASGLEAAAPHFRQS